MWTLLIATESVSSRNRLYLQTTSHPFVSFPPSHRDQLDRAVIVQKWRNTREVGVTEEQVSADLCWSVSAARGFKGVIDNVKTGAVMQRSEWPQHCWLSWLGTDSDLGHTRWEGTLWTINHLNWFFKNSSTSGHMWIVLSWSISLALWWKTFDNLIFKKWFYLNLIVNHLIAQKNSKDCIFFGLLINATFILFTCFLLTHQSDLRPSGRFPFLNLSCKYLFGGDASHCNCERGGQHGVVGSLRSNPRITDTTPCAPLWVED
jgi:hypothetical protein